MTADPSESGTEGRKNPQSKSSSVRLSINLSPEASDTLKELAESKRVTITEAVRRAITIWKFVEDEISQGNQLAVIQKDGTVRKVLILLYGLPGAYRLLP